MLPTYNNVIHFDNVPEKFSVHVVAYGEIVFVGNRKGEKHWWHYVKKVEVISTVMEFLFLNHFSEKLVFVFFKRWRGGDSCCYHLIETRVRKPFGLVVGKGQQCLSSVGISDMIEALNNEDKHLKI